MEKTWYEKSIEDHKDFLKKEQENYANIIISKGRKYGLNYISSFTHDIQKEIYQNSDSLITKRKMKYEDIIKKYKMYDTSPVFFTNTEYKYTIKSKEKDMKNKVYSWIAVKIDEKGELINTSEPFLGEGNIIATSEENARTKIFLQLEREGEKVVAPDSIEKPFNGEYLDPDKIKIFLRQW